jgi:hypothetical protein
MSPWRWTQIKGSKHVGQWNGTINVIELYILSDSECTEIGLWGMDWIHLAEDRKHSRAIMNNNKFSCLGGGGGCCVAKRLLNS